MIKKDYNKDSFKKINEIIQNQNVLFISTKNSDYLRNVQEVEVLKLHAAHVSIIAYGDKSYFLRLLKIYFWLLLHSLKKYDSVFIGFAPQLILPFFKRRFKNKIVLIDFFISMFDTLVDDRKIYKKSGRVASLLHKLDEKTIHAANWVICDTISHGDFFCSEFGLDRKKKIVLYLEADRNIYYPRSIEKTLGLEIQYTVLYFGSILPVQGIGIVLDAIDLLKKEKGIYFYIIGNLKMGINKTNATFFDWMPQDLLAEKIAESDLCLAGHFDDHIQKAKRTIPGKAFIYNAMNKPMILGDNPANRELFSDDQFCFFIEQGNPQALADMIFACYQRKAGTCL